MTDAADTPAAEAGSGVEGQVSPETGIVARVGRLGFPRRRISRWRDNPERQRAAQNGGQVKTCPFHNTPPNSLMSPFSGTSACTPPLRRHHQCKTERTKHVWLRNGIVSREGQTVSATCRDSYVAVARRCIHDLTLAVPPPTDDGPVGLEGQAVLPSSCNGHVAGAGWRVRNLHVVISPPTDNGPVGRQRQAVAPAPRNGLVAARTGRRGSCC